MTDLSAVSDDELLSSLPRGVRNHNPGNIEDGDFARSLPGYKGSDGRFAIFDNMENGAAAQARLLGSYGKRGINTVEGVVNRWAPRTENDTGSYVKFVSERLGVDPREPLDMNDERVVASMADAMGEHENGVAVRGPDLSEVSDEELLASLGGQKATAPATAARAVPPIVGNSTPVGSGTFDPRDLAALGKQKSQTLGLLESVAHIGKRVAPYTPANLIPGFREKNEASLEGLDKSIARRKQTATPGKIGRFLGDAIITGGMTGPLSPLVGGAVSGAVLGDSKDVPGLAKDAAFGALTARLAAAGSDALQLGVRKALSKAPQVLKPADLPGAVKKAYDAVDDSGFRFGKSQVAGLADDFSKTTASSALSKSAKDDATNIISYTRQLSKGDDLTLAQLEKLRGDIYEAMVKKGGDTGRLGVQFRQQIDALIDTVDDGTVRQARGLNARLKKADVVTRASKSADRAAEKDYGGDYGRKLKDRLSPLIDEMKPNRNLRGGTPDEMAALDRIVRGTKGQNLASTAGGMLDPRRLGGKILSTLTATGGGVGALPSGGLSLLIPTAQMGAGVTLTGMASRTARQNLDDLVKLIAAGGSKQALARVPTKASAAAEKAIARVLRPAVVTASVPALAAAKPKKSQRR